KKYFTLFTFTITFAALAWLTADMRIMVVCWGITLLGLTLLIRLTTAWQVTRIAAKVTAKLFLLSWVALLLGVLWIGILTGEWHYSTALDETHLSIISSWGQFGVNLLIVDRKSVV